MAKNQPPKAYTSYAALMRDRPAVITLTKSLAEELIAKAKVEGINRKLRDEQVEYMIELINNGSFVLSSPGIIFDQNGFMVNAQHRCWAISYIDKPVPMHVEYDYTPEQVAAIDTNIPRSFYDAMKMAGQGDEVNTLTASFAKGLVLGPGRKGRIKVPYDKVKLWYDYYKKGIDYACSFRWSRTVAGRPMSVAMGIVIARAYYEIDEATLNRFGDVFSTGQEIAKEDKAATTLRDLFNRKGLGTDIEAYFKTEIALQAFKDRRPLALIRLPKDETELFTALPKLPKLLEHKQTSARRKLGVMKAKLDEIVAVEQDKLAAKAAKAKA